MIFSIFLVGAKNGLAKDKSKARILDSGEIRGTSVCWSFLGAQG